MFPRTRGVAAAMSGRGISAYSGKVLSYSPVAYWIMNEASGTTAICQVDTNQNGTYARDVSTMGTGIGIGDGTTAPLFGSSDYLDVYSTTFRDAWDGNEGSISLWMRVETTDVWTDDTGVQQGDYYCLRIGADASNKVELYQDNTKFTWIRVGQGDNDYRQVTSSGWDLGWYNAVITWSKTSDEVIAYLDGAQQGAAVDYGADFAGALDSLLCNIGSNTQGPHNPWDGWIAHVAVWDSELSGSQALGLATV